MKTKAEIQTEAEQLTLLGKQYQATSDRNTLSLGATLVPLVLRRWPEPAAAASNDSQGDRLQFLPHRERQVEVLNEGAALTYRLVERDVGTQESFAPAPLVVFSSRSVFDVLRTGYELEEEDRLAAELEPYAEWGVERDIAADDDVVAKMETIIEASRLPHADRLRSKAEILEFLSGRLEPSEFIANAIERQLEREDGGERVARRSELRLTLDES